MAEEPSLRLLFFQSGILWEFRRSPDLIMKGATQLLKYIGLGFMLLSGIRLISRVSKALLEREMKRMLIAVVSGVLEGLLICAGLSTGNAVVLGVAVAFFVWQWIHLGK